MMVMPDANDSIVSVSCHYHLYTFTVKVMTLYSSEFYFEIHIECFIYAYSLTNCHFCMISHFLLSINSFLTSLDSRPLMFAE